MWRHQLLLGLSLLSLAHSQDLILTQDESQASVVRVSLATGECEVVLSGLPTMDSALDKDGSLLLLGRHSLHRLSPDGTPKSIVNDYAGAEWIAMALHRDGSVIAADSIRSSLWQIQPDGAVSIFSRVENGRNFFEAVGLVSTPSGLLWLRETKNNALVLLAVAEDGKIRETVPATGLRGPGKVSRFEVGSTVALSHGKLRSDEKGGAFFVDQASLGFFHLDDAFSLHRIAVPKSFHQSILVRADSFAYDAARQEIVFARPGSVVAFSLSGQTAPRTLSSSSLTRWIRLPTSALLVSPWAR